MYRFAFYMDQIAGHITNYRNLRSMSEQQTDLQTDWYEIHYKKPQGLIERAHKTLVPFVPTYITGVTRGTLEMHRALKQYRQYDALFTNAQVGVFFSDTFKKVPTMLDMDSTPLQIDRMPAYNDSDKPDIKAVADLKWRLFRKKVTAATLIQVWSNWVKASLVADYQVNTDKIVVNPPGVDLELWKPVTGISSQESKQPFRVLFVGGDFYRKGGQLLLDWYKTQEPQICELHVVTREAIKPGPGIFIYNNMQPNSEELVKLYHSCHLFVLPSLAECFGIATIEAMGTGLPVIASDVGGTADIIEHGHNGFIIPPNDLSALKCSISEILNDFARGEEMGRRSRTIAEQKFDLKKNAQLTFNYLKQVAESGRCHQ